MNVPSKQSCTGPISLQTLQKENASLREEVENMSLWLAGVISIWYHYDVCYRAADRSICLPLQRLDNELHNRSHTRARFKHANTLAVQLTQFAQLAVL